MLSITFITYTMITGTLSITYARLFEVEHTLLLQYTDNLGFT